MTTTFMSRSTIAATLLSGALLSLPVLVYAEDGMRSVERERVEVRTATTTPEVRGDIRERAIERANKELERRTGELESLKEHVGKLRAVSDDVKEELSKRLDDEKERFSELRSQMGIATTTDALRKTIKSITDSHRDFALTVQQTHVRAAADRVVVLAGKLEAVGTKLEGRIAEAKTAGKDVARLETLLGSMKAHIATAKTEAGKAVELVAPLVSDGGDEAKLKANRDVLNDAQKHIQTAHKEIVSAHKDAQEIVKGLRTFGEDKTATSTEEENN